MDVDWEDISCFSSVWHMTQLHNTIGYFQCFSAKNILVPEISIISQ